MNDRDLDNWLTAAGDSGQSPSLPEDLPARVRRRSKARRRKRVALFTSSAVVLLAAAAIPIAISSAPTRHFTATRQESLGFESQLASINEKLRELEQRVRALPDPDSPIDSVEADALAKRLLHLGAVLAEMDGQPEARDLAYASVAQLFPNSVWADVAQPNAPLTTP